MSDTAKFHRVLVVPELMKIELGESFLDRRSFAVRMCTTPEDALATVAVWRPHLILFSSELAPMGAVAFACAIKERPELAGLKLLMVTDQYTGGPIDDLLRVPCDAHLVQPIDERDLLHTIGALLQVPARRAPRLAVELLARVEDQPAKAEQPVSMFANILSLSDCGMLLESERHLTIGARDAITFVLPGLSQRVTIIGRVMTADELQLHYAIDFVEGENPEDLRRLRSFLAAAAPCSGDAGDGTEQTR